MITSASARPNLDLFSPTVLHRSARVSSVGDIARYFTHDELITRVGLPLTFAGIAYDYVDSMIDTLAFMKSRDFRPLCREIRAARAEWEQDDLRFWLTDGYRAREHEMYQLQEDAHRFFCEMYNEYFSEISRRFPKAGALAHEALTWGQVAASIFFVCRRLLGEADKFIEERTNIAGRSLFTGEMNVILRNVLAICKGLAGAPVQLDAAKDREDHIRKAIVDARINVPDAAVTVSDLDKTPLSENTTQSSTPNPQTAMEELVKQINEIIEAFRSDAQRALKGSKAAGQRARKVSNELTKLLKDFRKVSLEAAKFRVTCEDPFADQGEKPSE